MCERAVVEAVGAGLYGGGRGAGLRECGSGSRAGRERGERVSSVCASRVAAVPSRSCRVR
jgi:hypothetical protein